jgi:hypothetical protein
MIRLVLLGIPLYLASFTSVATLATDLGKLAKYPITLLLAPFTGGLVATLLADWSSRRIATSQLGEEDWRALDFLTQPACRSTAHRARRLSLTTRRWTKHRPEEIVAKLHDSEPAATFSKKLGALVE